MQSSRGQAEPACPRELYILPKDGDCVSGRRSCLLRSMLRPVETAADGLCPACEGFAAVRVVHLRLEGHVALPELLQLLLILPEADGQTFSMAVTRSIL